METLYVKIFFLCAHMYICVCIAMCACVFLHTHTWVHVCTHAQENWLKFAYFTGQRAVIISRAQEFPNLNFLNQVECPLFGMWSSKDPTLLKSKPEWLRHIIKFYVRPWVQNQTLQFTSSFTTHHVFLEEKKRFIFFYDKNCTFINNSGTSEKKRLKQNRQSHHLYLIILLFHFSV